MTRTTSKRIRTTVLLAGLVPLIVGGTAAAEDISWAKTGAAAAPPPAVELLSRGSVEKKRFEAEANGIELDAERRIDVAVAHLTFKPGASTGWHRHPGPTVVTITTGELTITDRRCRRQTFEAGDTFVEEGPRRHLAVNTAGTRTETIVTFFVPRGAALSSPASPPACAH
jgi:quercetin dioxygenase-like cupin family protein